MSRLGPPTSTRLVEALDPLSARFTHADLPTVMRCCMAMLGLAAKERWETTP